MRTRLTILAFLLAPLPAAAAPPCPENQPYEICLLEAQRDNAQNDLVRVASEQYRQEKWWQAYLIGEEEQRRAMDVWWKAYQDGLEEQRQTASKEGAAMAARAAEAVKGRGR